MARAATHENVYRSHGNSLHTPGAFAQSTAYKAEVFYRQGLAAEKAGDPATAGASNNAALALYPRLVNTKARHDEHALVISAC